MMDRLSVEKLHDRSAERRRDCMIDKLSVGEIARKIG
jgi:hypothetical protein